MIVRRQVLQEFAAVQRFIMRPRAPDEVEEGQVGHSVYIHTSAHSSPCLTDTNNVLHRHQREGRHNRHQSYALPYSLLMQTLPFRCESLQNLGHFTAIQERAGIQTFHLQIPLVNGLETLLRRRRYGLETPFLKGNPPEQLIRIQCSLFLPALLGGFPARPCRSSFRNHALLEGRFGSRDGGVSGDAFAVYQSPPG